MRRTLLLALTLPLAAGCNRTETVTREIQYPDLELSSALLEFGAGSADSPVERSFTLSNIGEMPMGVSAIDIGENMGANFTVAYSRSEITCPETTGGEDTASADAKSLDIDTGPADTDGGGGDDTGDGGSDPNVLFVLDPGCSIPVRVNFSPVDIGEIWGAVVVTSYQAALPDDAAEDELPEYLRDPIHWTQELFLHGSAERSQGALVVRPRSYDFGYVNPAMTESTAAYIGMENVGTGDVIITSVRLSDTCDASYTLGSAPVDGYPLVAGSSTVAEVVFTPTDDDPAYCQLTVVSDDPANPEVDVTLTANSGSDPNNSPPTVAIRDPDNGYRYSSIRDFELELNVFDVDQPATSLSCRVKSMILQEGDTLADCTPPDDTGHFWVTIPRDDMDAGSDVIAVTVTDGNGVTATATVAIVSDASYPASDDDGDGFGTDGEENLDCDDHNVNSYPHAAEVYDGEDNDCDSLVDETTVGYDDDGDGVSEEDGDCNDNNDSAYPGAPERGDGVDNDCDDTVDEGTSLYDDDGDGYAEVNNDCNDNDSAVNPAAEELCDGLDNDCDGLRDSADGCVAADSSPMIIGVLNPSQNACESGDKITIEAKIFDPDGQVPTLAWQDDAGATESLFDNPASQTVTWTCPELPDSSGGKAFNVWVTVTDPDSQQDYDFTKVAVYPKDYGLYDPYVEIETVPKEGLCATANGESAAWVAALAGLAALARRRSKR